MIKQLSYIFNRRDKVKIVFILFMVIVGSFFELMGVTIFMPFIQILMDPAIIKENVYLKYFYELFHFSNEQYFLAGLTGVIIFIYIFKNAFLAIEKNIIYRFCYNTQMNMSTRLLKAYMNKPYTFHLNKNVAELQRSMQEDTDLFTKGIIHILELIMEVTVCAVLAIYLFIVSKSIATLVLVMLVLCIGVFTTISKRYSIKLGQRSQRYKGKLYQWMNQSLGGIKEVKILNREDYFIDTYSAYFEKYVHGLRLNRLIAEMPRYFVEASCMTGILVAVLVKMFFGYNDITVYIPQLAVFAVAAFRLLPSVGKINVHVADILYSLPSFDLIYHDLKEIEGTPEKIIDGKKDWNFEKEILIKDVSYRYPDAEENVIDHADFSIEKGKTIAFIGSSGAGKTTMVDIILGLLQPQEGRVLADGMDIHRNPDTWHCELGYIPQVIYLSDDTIRNNIAFGVPKEEISDEAVITALKRAQLYDFIRNLPDGLDTFVGDRGVRLSGGQRQRIGIARALYHNPEILVLDEATSALDNETEAAVMEAIENLQGMKTMIIIAHRLTTIKNVDAIYEVAGGKVLPKAKEEVFG
ncbi:MAG: ABC transporter ATP-binding protein [Clostridiales bacterium]|nr:ABC transporter ATP-binding protein [Clostridiales bacterium]